MDAGLIQRLRELPRRQKEVWQGGPLRMPYWMKTDGDPVRPWSVWWASTGRVEDCVDATPSVPRRREQITTDEILEALVEFAETFVPAGYRPGAVRVSDAAFFHAAKPTLAAAEIEVQLADRLPYFDQAMRDLADIEETAPAGTDLLAAKGMTIDRVRAFAAAAAAFRAAKSWTHVHPEDLFRLLEPLHPSFEYFNAVFDGAGVGMIGSWVSRDDFEAVLDPRGEPFEADRWRLSFRPLWELSVPDSELWEREGPPLPDSSLAPDLVLFKADGRMRSPSTRDLAFAEGLFRLLAEARPEDLDRGRLEHRVETFDGPRLYRAEIPEITAPPEEDADASELDRALDALGRVRVARLKALLEREPENPAALHGMARSVPGNAESVALDERALALVERRIGPKRLATMAEHGDAAVDDDGELLLDILSDLGSARRDAGDLQGALDTFLRRRSFDADDRDRPLDDIVALQLALNRDADAKATLKGYADDDAFALYATALLVFRRTKGASKAPLDAAVAACKANPFVVDTIEETTPSSPTAAFDPGDSLEGERIAALLGPAWRNTPGALDVLFEASEEAEPEVEDEE